jgi:hypothetical protein
MADVTTTFAAKDESFAKTVDGLQKKMDGFSKQMEGFNSTLGNVGTSLIGLAGTLAGFAAAFVATQTVIQSFKAAIDIGGQLNELSLRTGESAGNLMILQRAFENAGAGADSVGPQLNKLQRFINEATDASSEQAKALARLGLSYDELKGKTPIEQMQLLANRLAAVKDDGERAALAMKIFEKSGGELLPLLRAMTEGLDKARQQLGSAPDAINLTAKALDDIGDNLGAISNKSTEFALGLLTTLAPALLDITTKIATIDAAGFGKAISGYIEATLKWASATFGLGSALDSIKAAIDGIASGNFAQGFDLLFLTAKNTGLNMINVLYDGGLAAIQLIGESLARIFRSDGPTVLLIKDLIRFIGYKIEETAAHIVRKIMDAAGLLSDSVRESLLKTEAIARRVGDEFQKSFLPEDFKASLSDVGNILAAAPQKFGQSFNANMKQPLFDIEGSMKRQLELQQQLTDQVDLTAFAETRLGQEIDKNTQKKISQLAGGDQKYVGMSDSQAAAAMAADSYAGAGMNEAAIAAAQKAAGAADGGGVGGGGGRSGGSSTPMSEMDRLKASGTIGSLADSMRITDRKSQDYQRARDESAKGRYNTAAGMMQRADAREQRSIESARLKDTARQQGFDNFDQMFRKANESMPITGKMTKEEYKQLLEGSSMSKDQKKAAQEDNGTRGTKAGKPSSDSLLSKVTEIYNWMTNNLPSNALS